jgi:glutathione peroxidase
LAEVEAFKESKSMKEFSWEAMTGIKSIYDIDLNAADGTPNFLQQFKGKAIMLVNTTVGCGNANQLEVLQWLQDEFGGDKFQVVGIPTNDYCGPGITKGKWSEGITCGMDSQKYGEDVYGTTFKYSEMISSNPNAEVIAQVSTHPGKNGVGQDLGEPHDLYVEASNHAAWLYSYHKQTEGDDYESDTDQYYSWWLNQKDSGINMGGNYEKYFFDKDGYLVRHLHCNALNYDAEKTIKESHEQDGRKFKRFSHFARSSKIFEEELAYTKNLIKELSENRISELNPAFGFKWK